MYQSLKHKLSGFVSSQQHIAPLVVLRIVFGSLMFFCTLRFALKGWIQDLYLAPSFHFTFYGLEWIRPLDAIGMYLAFVLMAAAALCIAFGLFYRLAALVFFILFTYIELIDKAYYLNHYYFVSLISFLMILVPAQRYFSLDVLRRPALKTTQVPAWTINIFKLQLTIVYVFAGISKITPEWLLEAMPLKIWLPANAHLPLIGTLMQQSWVAYLFAWFGMLFDLFIAFFLFNSSTRGFAYALVILFHVCTAFFFKIGMFPFIMMGLTLVFFSPEFHQRVINALRRLFNRAQESDKQQATVSVRGEKYIYVILTLYFIIQILLPFRYLLYPGELLWTEQGYRFSWRVMLMEKSGTTFFYVKDSESGKLTEVNNREFLTSFQEKMMSTQPDMILQYAHHLKKEFQKRGVKDPIVTTDAYIRLNGKGSRLMIDNTVDLAREEDNLQAKSWILSYQPDRR